MTARYRVTVIDPEVNCTLEQINPEDGEGETAQNVYSPLGEHYVLEETTDFLEAQGLHLVEDWVCPEGCQEAGYGRHVAIFEETP